MASNNGLRVKEQKITAIKKWPILRSEKEVQSFLTIADYHRRVIKHSSNTSSSLTERMKNVTFQWNQCDRQVFEFLK